MEALVWVLGIAAIASPIILVLILQRIGKSASNSTPPPQGGGSTGSSSGTGSSTPSSGKKISWKPWLYFGLEVLGFLFFLFVFSCVASSNPETKINVAWKTWHKIQPFWLVTVTFIFCRLIYRWALSYGLLTWVFWGLNVAFIWFMWPDGTPAGGDAGKEVEIIVTNIDNGSVVYHGAVGTTKETSWSGGEYFRVDVKVVPTENQCGKSVKVTCSYWARPVYLVACSDAHVDLPLRKEGYKVVVTAVQ